MSNTPPQHVNVDNVFTIWTCEQDSCDAMGHGVEVPVSHLADIGNPICSECEELLELTEGVIIK